MINFSDEEISRMTHISVDWNKSVTIDYCQKNFIIVKVFFKRSWKNFFLFNSSSFEFEIIKQPWDSARFLYNTVDSIAELNIRFNKMHKDKKKDI